MTLLGLFMNGDKAYVDRFCGCHNYLVDLTSALHTWTAISSLLNDNATKLRDTSRLMKKTSLSSAMSRIASFFATLDL